MTAQQVCSDFSSKVLIVDADPTVCEALAQTLKGAGYEPEVHLHPQSVVAGLDKVSYSLAFIDVNLPEINGVELASLVRKSGRLEELIFMGSNGNFEQAMRAIKLGAYDYLQKPFESNELRMLLLRLRERFVLQRRVRQAERRHFALIQNLPLLVFSLNRALGVEFINQACQELLEYSPAEAMGTPNWFLERVHAQERGELRAALSDAFVRGRPRSLECRMLQRGGGEVHGIIRFMPSLAGDEPGDGVTQRAREVEGFFVDITDRVYLEKALVQNEKLKTLAAISSEMAHEVRNPLMSIAGFARRLEKKVPDLPEVGIILREAQRLERLLNRIRDYLKPMGARPRECLVTEILSDSLGLLAGEMDDRGISCQVEEWKGIPVVLADPDSLLQVFVNLLRNGFTLMEPNGAFSIRFRELGDKLHVELHIPVRGGLGQDPEHLFMPFDADGEHFGLPLCYRLIKDMGGLLILAREGVCDVFTVSLPKGAATAVPPVVQPPLVPGD